MLEQAELKEKMKPIKMIVLDVDGVMTNGSVILNKTDEYKFFSALDGHGIRMLVRNGIRVAIITGRRSCAVERRASELGVEPEDLYQDAKLKLPCFKELLARRGLSKEQVAFMGDDVVDLPPMRHSGLAVAAPDAVDEVLEYADYVTRRAGGNGAVRELGDMILKAQGKWEHEMKRYMEDPE